MSNRKIGPSQTGDGPYSLAISECPKCGGKEYYRKVRHTGFCTRHYHMEEGQPANNDHFGDGFSEKTSKHVYCSDCDHCLGTFPDPDGEGLSGIENVANCGPERNS